ncbi:MAG: HIT family protein [Halanaeroarchaeum sp.]
MVECEFCAIIAGGQDAHVLFEDDHTLAFLDENPARDGHAIVVPKHHRAELLGTDGKTGQAVLSTVDDVAAALRAVLDPDGFSVFYTSGQLVGSVTHARVHVVPRDEDDGVSLALDRTSFDHDTAAALAERVRDAVESDGHAGT